MKKLFLAMLILSVANTASATYPPNTYNNRRVQQFLVRQKVVDLGQPYGVNTIVLPVSQVGLKSYYTVRGERDDDEFAEKVAQKLLSKLTVNAAAQEMQPQPQTQQPGANYEQTEPTPRLTRQASNLDAQIEAVFLKSCAKCHSGANPNGGLTLVNNGTIATLGASPQEITDAKWRIWDRVEGDGLPHDKLMPKGAQPLDGATVKLFREWARR